MVVAKAPSFVRIPPTFLVNLAGLFALAAAPGCGTMHVEARGIVVAGESCGHTLADGTSMAAATPIAEANVILGGGSPERWSEASCLQYLRERYHVPPAVHDKGRGVTDDTGAFAVSDAFSTWPWRKVIILCAYHPKFGEYAHTFCGREIPILRDGARITVRLQPRRPGSSLDKSCTDDR